MTHLPDFETQEMQWMHDTTFLLTKIRIMQKVEHWLGFCAEKMQPYLQAMATRLPEGCAVKARKIIKGEKYLELPYMVLDLPQFTQGARWLLMRTMFRWGGEFSCSLLLQDLPAVHRVTPALWQTWQGQDVFLTTARDPWAYHFDAGNYTPASQLSYEEALQHIQDCKFLKVARRLPLDAYEQLPEFCLSSAQLFLEPLF